MAKAISQSFIYACCSIILTINFSFQFMRIVIFAFIYCFHPLCAGIPASHMEQDSIQVLKKIEQINDAPRPSIADSSAPSVASNYKSPLSSKVNPRTGELQLVTFPTKSGRFFGVKYHAVHLLHAKSSSSKVFSTWVAFRLELSL